MGTKVLDDGYQYVKIHNLDRKRSFQFLTTRLDHQRHMDQLRDTSMVHKHDNFMDFEIAHIEDGVTTPKNIFSREKTNV